MLSAKSEAEIGERAARFLKAELKRADVTYDELAKRLKEYGRTKREIRSRPSSNGVHSPQLFS